MKELFKFFRSVLSESDGTGSWSRCGSLLIVLFTLGWVTHVVCKTHAIPDLGGATGFMTVGTGALYGTNKLSSIVSAVTGKGKDGTPTPTPTPIVAPPQ
jgi:hypothetical protein